MIPNHKILNYSAGGILLLLVFSFSLFKNISYPLLWHDEAETAMFGERILQYGYPKVHDGKNVLYNFDFEYAPGFGLLGLKEETDAYIGGALWGQYYFSVPGIYLADKMKNIYNQTASVRIPFALAGFLGILIGGLFGLFFFKPVSQRFAFFVFYFFANFICSCCLSPFLKASVSWPQGVLLFF